MQHIEEIRQRYFMECKKIISDLLYTENAQDLADNKYQIDKLVEKVSFLKVMSENPEIFSSENESETFVEEYPEILELSAEEEVAAVKISDDELNFGSAKEDAQPDATNIHTEEHAGENVQPLGENLEDYPEETFGKNNNSPEENIAAEEMAFEEIIEEASISEEAYQKSAELTQSEIEESQQEHYQEQKNEESARQKGEKKFKIPHIKGLKTIESLFENDSLAQDQVAEDSGSFKKTKVSTDFMEVEKPKQEFKLDLNDRIAFSKMLFGGSQSDMNEAVTKLNTFKTLDEAKEYLSDIYYQRNWKKVDEYAQRLWYLVENKFQ